MNRLLSFILCIVLGTVLSCHNAVMVFGDNSNTSMGNHSEMSSEMGKCMGSECESTCCFSSELYNQTAHVFTENNKKERDKYKYGLVELSFVVSLIYEWNLIGNLSPPKYYSSLDHYSYISLTGIIKSNT